MGDPPAWLGGAERAHEAPAGCAEPVDRQSGEVMCTPRAAFPALAGKAEIGRKLWFPMIATRGSRTARRSRSIGPRLAATKLLR